MFTGPTGTGKTTVARILALSLQCTTGKMGEPCPVCYKDRASFSIQEINASQVSGVEKIGQIVQGVEYLPPAGSRRRVYILDEAQRLSRDSQNLLLKYFEDIPLTTVWIICTTDKNKILETLRRRCQILELKLLQTMDIQKLVSRAFLHAQKNGLVDRRVQPLVDQLWEVGVQSPGLILNAVENYLGGMTAENAVKNLVTGFDVRAICRAMEKGDWNVIRVETHKATADDLRGIRAAVAGYLRAMLERQIPGPRAKEAAMAITRLAQVDAFTDATQGPGTVAALYELSQIFGGPKTERVDDDE